MTDDTVFEFEQTMSRADVAAYLREVADRLDEDGSLEFRAGGQSTTLSVPERLQFEVDVERGTDTRGSTEVEVEFELNWHEGEDGRAAGGLEIE